MKDSGRKFCKHMIHLLNCRKSFFSSGLYERSYEPKKLLIQLLANATQVLTYKSLCNSSSLREQHSRENDFFRTGYIYQRCIIFN